MAIGLVLGYAFLHAYTFRSLLFSVASAGIGWRYGRDAEAEWGGLCGSGLAQSPVDLGGGQAEFAGDLGELVFVKYDTKVRLWELHLGLVILFYFLATNPGYTRHNQYGEKMNN